MTFRYTAAALALATAAPCLAQSPPETETFEGYDLPERGFDNGATLRDSTELDIGRDVGPGLGFPLAYAQFGDDFFWSGWAVSNRVDTVTGNASNEHSAYPGTGANGSAQFAVAFGDTRINSNIVDAEQAITELYVANTTYAARVMQDGNQFSKKFGGVSGDDPDFFSVTFRGYTDGRLGGEPSADSVTVFLADYRYADNTQDYILDEWVAVDLTPLGNVSYVTLRFDGSDVGDFGLNTPTYVAVDDVTVRIDDSSGLLARSAAPAPQVFPSVAKEVLHVTLARRADFEVVDMLGRRALRGETARDVDVSGLSPGAYAIRFRENGAWTSAARFVRAD